MADDMQKEIPLGEENRNKSRRNRILAGLVLVVLLLLAGVIGYFSGKYGGRNTGTGDVNTFVYEGETTGSNHDTEQNGETEESPDTEPAQESTPEETSNSQTDENGEQTSGADNTETTENNPMQGDDELLHVTVNRDNEWGEAPKYIQLNVKLENISDKNVDGWTLQINVGSDAVIDNSWSSNCSIADGVLTATNVDYNSFLAPNGACDFGIIIANLTGDLSVKVSAGKTSEPSNDNTGGNQNNQNQNNQNNNQQANTTMLEVPEPSTDDWLFVEGNKIVDREGKEVWLTGINWFGYNTGTNTFDGLWACDLNTSLQAIANHGFNLLRIPISAELILQWKNGEYPSANFNQATNFYLVGMNSLEIFDYVIGQCRANGLKIMIDIHCAKTDSMGHMANLWYTDAISTEDYQEALCWMADRYKNDDTIIAYDLKNEPHGKPYEDNKAIWNDSEEQNNWKYVAQETALKVLKQNPNVLIMVEGIEIYPTDLEANRDYSSKDDADYYFNWWGGNLRGVADFPIELGQYQNKLVYSPHDYGPAVYQQPWFYSGYNYDTLYDDCWHDNWLYIYEEDIAPLLIGEWGGFMTEPNLTWMTHLRTLIQNYHLHHTFWCFNANSGDTGGLVKDDFMTWDEEKYTFVKEALWQENGKFVGLDHEIPLGTAGNGITLSEAAGLK